MSITYIGNCKLTTTGTSFKRDLWGLDTMTRTYKVRADQEKATLEQFRSRNISDPDFPLLTLQDVTFSHSEGPFSIITANYRGLLKEQEPEVQISFSVQDETVELVNVSSLATISLDYRAPQTTYTYSTKTPPTKFRYKNKTFDFKENLQITNKRGFAGGKLILVKNGSIELVNIGGRIFFQIDGQTIGQAAATGLFLKFYNTVPYALEDVISLSFDQVGSLYAVTEVVTKRVIRPDFSTFLAG